jgi:hypothetical protein
MNALIKSLVGAKSDHTAFESFEVIPVVAPLVVPLAANSDWFDDLAPELFGIPEYDNEPWVDETSGIDETWSRVQDLWLRLTRHRGIACTTVTDPIQGNQLLMFRIQGGATDCEETLLLEIAACSSTYTWCEAGRHGSLISHLAWYGDTLVMDLTPFQQMQTWPCGQGLVWQMQTLLCRLRGPGCRA